MTAEPLDGFGPDPDDIVGRLPERERERFLAEYHRALDAAHETWRYRQLRDLLRLWHLRAIAYAQPDYLERAQDAITGRDFIPAEQVIPGWPTAR